MTTWIRADVDLGAPFKTLILHGRSELGREFLRDWTVKDIKDNHNALLQANLVEKFIEKVRPELKDCIVIGMQCSLTGYQWKFNVIHTSFKRVAAYEICEERLELCPVCKKPLSVKGEQQWLSVINGIGVEVCSEKCYKESDTSMYNVDKVNMVQNRTGLPNIGDPYPHIIEGNEDINDA